MATIWNSNNVDVLKSLWAKGCKAEVIALSLKTSKNAVIGKANRLRLGSHKGLMVSTKRRGSTAKQRAWLFGFTINTHSTP